MKHLCFLLFSFLFAGYCMAQEQKVKPKFISAVRVGFAEGQAGSAFVLQTVNGWKWQSFSAGLGVGLDYYGMRSVPLFIDLQKNILSSSKTPYLYLDGGIHVPWQSQKIDDFVSKTSPGLYYEAGIGYLIPVKMNAVLFSVGYSYKGYKEERESPVWCFTGNCANDVQQLSYQLRRIGVRMGFRF